VVLVRLCGIFIVLTLVKTAAVLLMAIVNYFRAESALKALVSKGVLVMDKTADKDGGSF
jgi:hypothetical protein